MSVHQAFRRQPVPGEYAQRHRTTTIPAPTRGLIQHENEAFIGPGSCIVLDNWMPMQRGIKLRGGCVRWCVLPEATKVISAFEYQSGDIWRMFAGNATKLYDVTANAPPTLVKSGQTNGNYSAAQLETANGTDWLIALNDTGDPPLRYNGTTWTVLNSAAIANWANNTAYAIGALAKDTADSTYWRCLVAHTSPAAGTFAADRTANPTRWTSTAADGASWITGPAGTPVVNGNGLSYVWKYRNRLFFIGANTMDAWYLGIDSVGGVLAKIPLSGAASRGGRLLYGASWSIDAGDGIDDKCVFVTDQGEVLIFSGNNPGDPNNWRQEGRYQVSPPLGKNGHANIGGDLALLTVDGMVPLSQAITKDAGQLELAMLTRAIKPLWREQVTARRAEHWSIKKWDEYGGWFVAIPGGTVEKFCLAANNVTGAWCRFVGYDATCFIRMRADMFFGTQNGVIMQADRTGYDDGLPYVATMVGGWEMFRSPSQTVVWHQARAIFKAKLFEVFLPKLSATVDFVVTIPPPPISPIDPGVADVWDEGLWDVAKWDAAMPDQPTNRNTMWVSIGKTGFTHAPIVQCTVARQSRPDVELIAIGATYEVGGVNV